MNKYFKAIKQYKFSILTLLAVLTLSLMKSSSMPSSQMWNIFGIDKVVHFSMYFSLTFIIFFEKELNSSKLSFKKALLPITILIILGAIIEIIQPIVSNRSCELFDFFANSIGVFAGFYLNYLTGKKIKKLLNISK
jgi:VanZ family protein